MQSSNLEAAKAARDAYATQYERDAFAAGYDHAHGIACHNVPRIGEEYWTDDMGRVTPQTVEEARELHASLCYAAESHSRCYSPWEFTAKEINDLDEERGEGASEAAWEAYDAGVALAIAHDLEGYGAAQYGADEEE